MEEGKETVDGVERSVRKCAGMELLLERVIGTASRRRVRAVAFAPLVVVVEGRETRVEVAAVEGKATGPCGGEIGVEGGASGWLVLSILPLFTAVDTGVCASSSSSSEAASSQESGASAASLDGGRDSGLDVLFGLVDVEVVVEGLVDGLVESATEVVSRVRDESWRSRSSGFAAIVAC